MIKKWPRTAKVLQHLQQLQQLLFQVAMSFEDILKKNSEKN
jgi:hypothetical protein